MISDETEILTQTSISGKFSSASEANMDKQTSVVFDSSHDHAASPRSVRTLTMLEVGSLVIREKFGDTGPEPGRSVERLRTLTQKLGLRTDGIDLSGIG